jgi:hypothetical protein
MDDSLVRSPSSVRPLTSSVPDVIVVPPSQPKKDVVGGLFESSGTLQELVILNTEKGFVPSTLRLRKGTKYLFHVVNVNPQEKNLSFILDAFAEHRATYYGQLNEFTIEPKKEGVYSFECPETSFEGRMVVFAPETAKMSPAAPSSQPAKDKKNEAPPQVLRLPSAVSESLP